MADDEFDIDIYGDTAEPDYKKDEEGDVQIDSPAVPETTETSVDDGAARSNGVKHEEQEDDYVDIKTEPPQPEEMAQKIKSTDDSGPSGPSIPKQAPQQQGVKRKEGSDDRPIDPGATTALSISELHWWNTDDDIRGWVNQAECEDELKEITFSEHKVNGKSKGQAYVEFTTQQAATAAKHKIESFGEGQQYVKKHIVTYSNPNINPFKTLPKDVPARADKSGPGNRATGSYNNSQSNGGSGNFGGNNFRGNRTPGYNSGRGGMNNVGAGGYNRNFSNPVMGGINSGGGFQGGMTGFPNGSMGNTFNRGGMMNGMRGGFNNMRGGRGGMGTSMMNMPGMGMNGMGGMANGMMNMPGMMGAMGSMQGMQQSFTKQPHYQAISTIYGLPPAFTAPSQLVQQPFGSMGNTPFNSQSPEPIWVRDNTGQQARSQSHSATPHSLAPVNSSSVNSIPVNSRRRSRSSRKSTSQETELRGGGGQSQLYAQEAKQHPNIGTGFPANGMQGMPHFNPAFFQQNAAGGAGGGDQWQNPHGVKRQRPE